MANYNINGKIVSDTDLANTIAGQIASGAITKEQGLTLTQEAMKNATNQSVNTTVPQQTTQNPQPVQNSTQINTPQQPIIQQNDTTQANTIQTPQNTNNEALNVSTQNQAISTPQKTVETPKPVETTPTIQPTTTKTQEVSPEVNKLLQGQEAIDLYKQRGSNLSDLENLVEAKYPGTVATQENGKLTAVIDGVKYQWENNQYGDPVKTTIGKVDQQITPELTSDNIYNTLLSGGQVDTTSTNYQEAKTRYDNYNKYKDYTAELFKSAFSEGLILPGTQLYNDLQKDSKIKLQMDKATALNRITGVTTDKTKAEETQTSEILNNTKTVINGEVMTLNKAMEDGYISEDEMTTMTNNKEVLSKAKEVEELKNKTDELQAQYDGIADSIEASLKGTGATKDQMAVAIGNAQKGLLGNLNLAISKYNNAFGTLTDLKTNASKLFATNLENYYKAEERAQALADIQSEREYQTQQTQQQQEYQTQQVQTEYNNQVKLLEEQQKYKEIPTSIITDNATGNQSLINSQTGEILKTYNTGLTPTKTTESWTKLNDNSLYNKITGETKTMSSSEADTSGNLVQNNPQSIVDYSTQLRGRTNLQCGELVNDYVKQITGTKGTMGDTYTSKVQALNKVGASSTPQVGGLFAFDTADKVGHTGIVQSVNNDGSITVLEANRAGTKAGTPPTIRNYSKVSVDKMKFSQPVGGGTTQISNSDITAYNSATPSEKAKILKTKTGKNITDTRNQIYSDPNANIDDIIKYSQGGKIINQTSETSLQKYNQALNQIGDLTKNINSASTGPILGIIRSNNPYDVKAQEIKAQLNALVPNLARGVYGEVGVLTDNDIANYVKTIPNLKSTKDVNNAILSMTLKSIANGYKSQLQSLARAGYNVSGYTGLYKNIDSKVNELLKTTTGNTTKTATPIKVNDADIMKALNSVYNKG